MIEAGTTIWRCFHRPHAVTARTRCLKWCLRRTGSDVTHVTCVYLLVPALLSSEPRPEPVVAVAEESRSQARLLADRLDRLFRTVHARYRGPYYRDELGKVFASSRHDVPAAVPRRPAAPAGLPGRQGHRRLDDLPLGVAHVCGIPRNPGTAADPAGTAPARDRRSSLR